MDIKNRKAYFDYEVSETIEAGIALTGTEIKSIRSGSVDLKEAFVVIKQNEANLINMYIAPYKEGNQFNHEERRTRKLLLHKKEIVKLKNQINLEGITLVPLKMYFLRNHMKLLIGVCKGKKLYDKRESIKKKDLEREERRQF